MKNTYSTILSLPRLDFAILLFRLGISILMLFHGVPKLLRLFGEEDIVFADPIGLGQTFSFTFAVFSEFICSILIIIGLGTRFAVIPLIITMAVAAIIVHYPDGLARQELPFLYLLGYFMLFYTGSGKYSLDHYILAKNKIEGK